MIEGISFVSDSLRLYNIREELYMRADKPIDSEFVRLVEELYADIFEYQAKVIYHLSQNPAKRGFRSITNWDDWKGTLEQIKTSDKRCKNYCDQFDQKIERDRYEKQSRDIETSIEIQNRILEGIEAFQPNRDSERRDDRERELLHDLASDYTTDKDSIAKRIEGTCEWFCKDERFLEWRDNKYSSLLWVSAGPGCGKSVLSRFLVDERKVCKSIPASTVCYFFFKYGQEQRMHSTDALSAILHQLCEKPAPIPQALASHKNYGKKLRDTFSELWTLIVESAKNPAAGEVICVLDALDECEEISRKQLIDTLVGFFEQGVESSFTLKFLVTSRPYDDVEQNLNRLAGANTYLRFDGDDKSESISREIDLVIDATVPEIASDFNEKDRKAISNRLKKMNNRTYLWLFLTIDIIKQSWASYRKLSSIDFLLSSLPTKVSDAYERILSKSPDKGRAQTLLQIIVAATRPLSLAELNIALTIATQAEGLTLQKTLDLWPPETFKSTIQNMCGLFVSIHDGKASLIHQTAREFLLKATDPYCVLSEKWQGCFDMATAHSVISKICLIYLNLDKVGRFLEKTRDEIAYPDDENKLVSYAIFNWPLHYSSQYSDPAADTLNLAYGLCNESVSQKNWFSHYMEAHGKSSDFVNKENRQTG